MRILLAWMLMVGFAFGQNAVLVDPPTQTLLQTNIFKSNILAGANISISKGAKGVLTIIGSPGAATTNYDGIFVTNKIFGTSYIYAVTTNNVPTAIVSREILTNLLGNAGGTNFNGIFVTNSIFGTNYVYAVTTNNVLTAIVSREILTNVIESFANSLATTNDVNQRQWGTLVLTNLSGNPIPFTNIIVADIGIALGTNGGITYITNTMNTNAFQPASANLTNWALYGTNVILQTATNGVTVAAGANITVTTNGSSTGFIYTVAASAAGEANVNGEVSVTNATRMGLVYDKVGVTNRLRSVQGGNGITLTNQGTNLMVALTTDPTAYQPANALLSNLVNNPYTAYTNQVFGGTNISVRTAGGTNFIDTIGNLNDWSQIPTGAMANVVSTTFLTNWANAVSNYVTAATNSTSVTNWINFRQPASANLTNWSNIPTGAMANVVSTDFLTNWANSISNLTQTKQNGSAVLTNLVGTVANNVTNVVSLSTTNSTSKPLTNSYTAGVLTMFGIEQGSGLALTMNSNIVIANDWTKTASTTNVVGVSNWVNAVSNYVTAATNSASVTNWINSRQPADAVLSNLVGTVTRNVTNVVSLSTTNATSKPLTNSYTAGVLTIFGIEQGSGLALTMNSNIVIANDWAATASTTNVVGVSNWVNAVSNYVTAATNSASVTNWINSRQPASANLTNWSLIPTGSMANVVSTDFLTNWANAISNLTATKQNGSALLTNLVNNPYTGYTNQVFGGTNISVRTAGGTNFIDTIGQLNNWSKYDTNVILQTATNGVTVAAGANVTVTTNGTSSGFIYTIAGSAGSAGPFISNFFGLGTNTTFNASDSNNVSVTINSIVGQTNHALRVTSTNGATIMAVDPAKKRVGIGTDVPMDTLDIENGGIMIGTCTLTNNNFDLLINSTVSGGAQFRMLPFSGDTYFENTFSEGQMIFRLYVGANAYEVERFNTYGFVGIGTNTPQASLHVTKGFVVKSSQPLTYPIARFDSDQQVDVVVITNTGIIVNGSAVITNGLVIKNYNATSNYVWTCTNSTTGEGEWRIAPGASGGEANVNGEVSVTNGTTIGLVYDKVGVTNRLRSLMAGLGMVLTNEGTNIMIASTVGLTTNVNQFLGVPLSIRDSARVTNMFLYGVSTIAQGDWIGWPDGLLLEEVTPGGKVLEIVGNGMQIFNGYFEMPVMTASRLAVWDGNKFLTNGALSEGDINAKQFGAAALSNLVGTVANNVTNVVSLSTTNATSKPLTNAYAAGVLTLFGLEAGANITLTPNGSNIVVASTASGGGISTNANQFGANTTLNIKYGALLTNTLFWQSNTAGPSGIAQSDIGGITNVWEWRQSNGVPSVMINSNAQLSFGHDDIKTAIAFRTNQIDLSTYQWKPFTNSLQTNVVLQLTNLTAGVATTLDIYGAGIFGGTVTNAWQVAFTAAAGTTIKWPTGATNGNYDVLVNSNQVVQVNLWCSRTTNIIASYKAFE